MRKMHKSDVDASLRWRVLGLSCVVLWGQYFCYDIPAVVHDHLAAYSGVASQDYPWYFNSLYSAYSLPNLILPLAFGWILDRSSGSVIILLLASITCIGQLCVSLGMGQSLALLFAYIRRSIVSNPLGGYRREIHLRYWCRVDGCSTECNPDSLL